MMTEHCWICGIEVPYDMKHFDQRFLIGFCDVHADVPPAHGDKAKQQYKENGVTEWDRTGDRV